MTGKCYVGFDITPRNDFGLNDLFRDFTVNNYYVI